MIVASFALMMTQQAVMHARDEERLSRAHISEVEQLTFDRLTADFRVTLTSLAEAIARHRRGNLLHHETVSRAAVLDEYAQCTTMISAWCESLRKMVQKMIQNHQQLDHRETSARAVIVDQYHRASLLFACLAEELRERRATVQRIALN